MVEQGVLNTTELSFEGLLMQRDARSRARVSAREAWPSSGLF